MAWAAGEERAFYALRLVSLSLLLPTLLLTWRIVRRLAPGRPEFAAAATLFTGLNPSLLSIFASVQNDGLTIVLALWATDLSIRWLIDESPTIARAAALGGVVSLAVLSKASAVYLIPVIPLLALALHRRKAATFVAVFSVVVVLGVGWWFARNVVLYGDLTAQQGLRDNGYTNAPPPTPLWQPAALYHWLWVIESYYWLPIQWYRDVFHAPIWLRGIVGIGTLVPALGWARAAVKRRVRLAALDRRVGLFLLGLYGTCFLIYTYSCMRVTHFAPRTTFPTFIVYAGFIGIGGCLLVGGAEGRSRRSTFWMALLAVGLLMANAYCLTQAWRMPIYPYHLFV